VSNCPCEPTTAVGQVAQHQVEAELDSVIRELGAASVRAMNSGDPQGARLYSRRMYEAIDSRTPEHKARLAAEVERLISQGLGFFATAGERDRAVMERRAA